jgi:molybdopterin synthase sulfur carrier subunit
MTVSVLIPRPLRALTDGGSRVVLETTGNTLRDALDALFAAHPAIRDRVCTEQGEIREHVNVFVGDTVARWAEGLATPITNGVEISIIPAISGG